MALAWRWLVACSTAMAASLAGCGPSGNASCGQVQPCGGDPVGSWSFVGGCANEALLNAQLRETCPQASIDVLEFTASGRVTFNADLTFTSEMRRRISARETFPLSCNTTLATSCAELSQTVTAGMESIVTTCTGGATCDCSVTLAQNPAFDTGNYTISGTALVAPGALGASNYCVNGSLLHFIQLPTPMAMGPMGQTAVQSDLVAHRQ